MRDILRVPGMRLLVAGETTSTFGDWLLLLVLGIWVKTLTGSNSLAGAMALTFAAPSLLSPLFGWVVDRFRRRPFLIMANLLSGAALLPLLAVTSRHDVWIIFFCGALYGISMNVTGGAFSGLIKILVPDELVGAANGVFSGIRQSMRLVGPLLGAGLFAAVGGRVVTLIDIGSFCVAAGALALIHLPQARVERTELHWLHEVSAGVRHAWRVPVLRRTTAAVAVGMLALGAVDTMIYAFIDEGLHRPPTFLGVLVTVQGIGAVLGALNAARTMRRIGEVAVLAIGLAAFGAAIAVLVYPTLWLTFVALPVSGIGNGVAFVAFGTLLQRRTPGLLMGRVSAATDMVIGGAQTLSMVVGVTLIAIVDYRYMFAVIAAVLLLASGWLWTTRRDSAPGTTPPAEAEVTTPVDPALVA
jgi:MFS family permease